ncbi:3-phosphoshikimate 1-carboxyvinyltransferase, partial [hydrothermal vent metagenome]
MIQIIPVTGINTAIAVPGSKSLTQRALIAAALAKGKS